MYIFIYDVYLLKQKKTTDQDIFISNYLLQIFYMKLFVSNYIF